MTTLINKHPNRRNLLANLVLLGIAGVILIRLITIALYTALPNEYFLEVYDITVEEVNPCAPQEMKVTGVRKIYPYLPDNLVRDKALQAELNIELFTSTGRKIDDIIRHPVLEWREGGIGTTQWEFKTTLLPGDYYVTMHYFIELPLIGKRETPTVIRTNTFTVGECKPLQAKLKAN